MFRFRLQRVLELRERKERDAATALASAQEALDQARAEEQQLMEARDALAARSSEPNDELPSVGALRTLHFLLGRLDERVANAVSATDSAEHVASQKQEALRAAFRDRRTIDRLRERHEETWRAAENAADRQLMDEIALTRYAQPGAASGTTDTQHES